MPYKELKRISILKSQKITPPKLKKNRISWDHWAGIFEKPAFLKIRALRYFAHLDPFSSLFSFRLTFSFFEVPKVRSGSFDAIFWNGIFILFCSSRSIFTRFFRFRFSSFLGSSEVFQGEQSRKTLLGGILNTGEPKWLLSGSVWFETANIRPRVQDPGVSI